MEKNYSEVGWISYFRGEYANDYRTHLDYVEAGAWEKDYFAHWLEADDDYYPELDEIASFCINLQKAIEKWFEGVEAGVIDSEAGWED